MNYINRWNFLNILSIIFVLIFNNASIDFGQKFSSRAEMMAVGLHGH